eukprot:scaffold41379_cov71-Phaeocystis_antarctica.AAC.4
MAKPSAVRTVQAQEPIHWLRTGSCLPVRWSSTRHTSPAAAQSTSKAHCAAKADSCEGSAKVPVARCMLAAAAAGCAAVWILGLGLAAAAATAASRSGSSLRRASAANSHGIRTATQDWDVTSGQVAGFRSLALYCPILGRNAYYR